MTGWDHTGTAGRREAPPEGIGGGHHTRAHLPRMHALPHPTVRPTPPPEDARGARCGRWKRLEAGIMSILLYKNQQKKALAYILHGLIRKRAS